MNYSMETKQGNEYMIAHNGKENWVDSCLILNEDGSFYVSAGRLSKTYKSLTRAVKWLKEQRPMWGYC